MKTLNEKISELCKELEVPDPVEFLTQVMAGQDPRQLSRLYEMIIKFENEYGPNTLPDEWDYIELVEYVKDRYKHFPVSLSESHAAAKQILEYTHAKKKQIDQSVVVEDATEVKELTSKEIRLFSRKFNREY